MIEKYHMRKQEREIKDKSEIIEIIKRGKFITLALSKSNNPYIVTLSYGYDEVENSIYMHAALEGMKLHIIKSNSKVCATIIEDKGYVEKICSHKYITCVLEGEIVIINDINEKTHGMEVLLNHLEKNPQNTKENHLKNKEAYKHFSVLKINIRNFSGKKSL